MMRFELRTTRREELVDMTRQVAEAVAEAGRDETARRWSSARTRPRPSPSTRTPTPTS